MTRYWVVRVEWRLAKMPEQDQVRQVEAILGEVGFVGGHLWALVRSEAETEAGAISDAVARFARATAEVDPPVELHDRVWAEIDGAEDDGRGALRVVPA